MISKKFIRISAYIKVTTGFFKNMAIRHLNEGRHGRSRMFKNQPLNGVELKYGFRSAISKWQHYGKS